MSAATADTRHVDVDADPSIGPRHLNQNELSRRWTISPRTLERWRWRNEGPAYLKIGGRVAYRLADIEAYEAKRIQVVEDHFGTAR